MISSIDAAEADRGDTPTKIANPLAARAAASSCTLLLTGATGTGKGHLARWIHDHSARASRPFVPVNCGALPEGLIDSHLFGHARGSFSGASHDHLGLVRAAEGGTLLLDEISELPPTAQVRLLRLLEEREVQPVGYSSPLHVNVRVVAATNIDLAGAVQAGRFRQDLYFRLDIVRLHLPPLRDRRNEIPGFIELFNQEFAQLHRQRELTFADDAMEVLTSHDWPGNVRQLRTVIERLHVLCGSAARISADDLQTAGQLATKSQCVAHGAAKLASVKLDVVNDIIASCRGNVSRAAAIIGVHRSTLYRWLAEQAVPA